MNLTYFYRGLLFSIGELVSNIDCTEPKFSNNFMQLLHYAKNNNIDLPSDKGIDLIDNFDPVYGISYNASKMIFRGELDYIVFINNTLTSITFKLSKEECSSHLNELEHKDIFRLLAKEFVYQTFR